MIRGIYIAASSAIAETKRIDVIANNVANANTAGFKKDVMITESFPEVLISRINGRDKQSLSGSNKSDNGFNIENEGDVYSVSAGAGYINVQTAQGISRNKSVQFTVDQEGYLVTSQGNYILGQNGPINTGGAPVNIDNKGQVLADGTVVDRLKVSNPLSAIGNLSYGIRTQEINTNYEQGQVFGTGNDFDLAIEGKGFFSVETPQGERYTRSGEFTRDNEGYLVTKEGHKVLGENGPILLEGKDLTINEKGEVYAGGELQDKLKLVEFSDYTLLRKEGNGLVKIADGITMEPETAEVNIRQGFLEGSNVNSVKEMVSMMTMLRSYEANQKLIKIHDELLGKAVSEIARV